VCTVKMMLLEADSPEPQQPRPGQNTVGSGLQSAVPMMGVKTPKTC